MLLPVSCVSPGSLSLSFSVRPLLRPLGPRIHTAAAQPKRPKERKDNIPSLLTVLKNPTGLGTMALIISL